MESQLRREQNRAVSTSKLIYMTNTCVGCILPLRMCMYYLPHIYLLTITVCVLICFSLPLSLLRWLAGWLVSFPWLQRRFCGFVLVHVCTCPWPPNAWLLVKRVYILACVCVLCVPIPWLFLLMAVVSIYVDYLVVFVSVCSCPFPWLLLSFSLHIHGNSLLLIPPACIFALSPDFFSLAGWLIDVSVLAPYHWLLVPCRLAYCS